MYFLHKLLRKSTDVKIKDLDGYADMTSPLSVHFMGTARKYHPPIDLTSLQVYGLR